MRRIVLILAAIALAGCGVETASTAATAGQIKKRELEQGKKTLEQAQQRINQSTEQMQRRADEAADK
jgi:outer membrane PBP1 activator LpoA protein